MNYGARMNYGGNGHFSGAGGWNMGGYGMMDYPPQACEAGPNFNYPSQQQYFNNTSGHQTPFWGPSPTGMRGGRFPFKDRGGHRHSNRMFPSQNRKHFPAQFQQGRPATEEERLQAENKEGHHDHPLEAAAPAEDGEAKEEQEEADETGAVAANVSQEADQGEVPSVSEVLKGRNPIMYCNEQSKLRRLIMKWDQTGESGPPHDKTFTWDLSVGDMVTTGSANSKKGAKNAAAEEMVKKLCQLPKLVKRAHNQFPSQANQQPFMGFNPQYNPQQQPFVQYPSNYGGALKKRKMGPESHDQGQEQQEQQLELNPERENPLQEQQQDLVLLQDKQRQVDEKVLNPAQNNPISKLYEHCKQRKLPDPQFEMSHERILESVRTVKGFYVKKTEFTMTCEVYGKTYFGMGRTKKQAKFNAAEAAWAEVEIGAVCGEDSSSGAIVSLLKSEREKATLAGETTAHVTSSE